MAAMAMLKFVRREVRSSGTLSLVLEDDIEVAKKGVTKALNTVNTRSVGNITITHQSNELRLVNIL